MEKSYPIDWNSYQSILYSDDHYEYHLYKVQYGDDQYRTTTNAGYEMDDVSDAAYILVYVEWLSVGTHMYFLSLLITILLTIAFRYIINEEKFYNKLEANKAKPKKKSGFMARLAEAQRIQQQQLNERNKSDSTRRKII